ncbi:MAG: DUF3574 domain-containing protein [Pseudonocardiaceae bacterium]
MRDDRTGRHRAGNWWGHRHSATTVGAALLVVGPLMGCAGTYLPAVAANSSAAPACGIGATAPYVRTELYFGKSIPGGGTVPDAAFAQFLDQEVTPRFPAGFTVVPARGQYRQANGVITHEASDMMILFYPRDSASDASEKIDEIRAAYDKTFRQESVLREDEQPSCVSF